MTDESREIDVVVQRIADRFPQLPTDEVREQVLAELDRFDDAHVRDFVPVLVENAVMDTLRSSLDPTPVATTDEPA
ncbi:three-helix bundle dimerization domain-containing protein [Cellulosimicrobium marinum]|uniref:three-helix bundle dimerization domain-containing protein n=1 Tax=Cellulosimicrobium marinum TaxID=1638992 RepID=UPI001E56F4D8|nr:hypothetical protein [Cellulosimicrobium marinum]MCB7135216.1 hypothetical protein [Cellulosimicrobium marinum]